MTTDPNAQIVPDDPEPEPASPSPPQIDLEAAYRAVSENEGWDPRLARYEMQEIKRRKDDLERKEREFQERILPPRQPDPMPDFGGDQYARMIYENKQETAEVKRMLLERERRDSEVEKRKQLEDKIGVELNDSFNNFARQNGITKDQVEKQEQEFYRLLLEMYPEPEMIERLGADRVIRNTFRAFRANGNAPQPTRSYRDPRATFVVPSGTSGGPMGDDMGPRRSNESQEEYVARLKRVLDEAGGKMSSLPERAVINPG